MLTRQRITTFMSSNMRIPMLIISKVGIVLMDHGEAWNGVSNLKATYATRKGHEC